MANSHACRRLSGFETETVARTRAALPSTAALCRSSVWKHDGIIDGATLWVLDAHARGLLDVCGGCEKIRGTPLSPSYRSLLRAGLVVNVLAGPWLTAPEIGFWSVPLFELMCFFLLGVELIDSVVEEPFGRERDDLDLDTYCQDDPRRRGGEFAVAMTASNAASHHDFISQQIKPRSATRCLVTGVGSPARKYQSFPRWVRIPGVRVTRV